MEEVVVKTNNIAYYNWGPYPQSWAYKIIFLSDKDIYRADLWGYPDDYQDYLYRFGKQESSPEFSTKEEAISYAQKDWVAE